MRIRELAKLEIGSVWSIDRAEVIDGIYRFVGGELVLAREHHDVRGWPAGEPERDGALLLDCLEQGGTAYGAFDGGVLIGAAVLESRFIGRAGDQLQLKFLHVSRRHRGAGLGRTLFGKVVTRARELGARRLYVSATPSENTLRFYLRRGCRVTDDVDAGLFALEPEDIHLEFEIPDRDGPAEVETMKETLTARLSKAINEHDLDAFAATFAIDYRSEQPAHPGRAFTGRDTARSHWANFFALVPDFRAEVLRAASVEGAEWAEWRWYGTQTDGTPFDVRGVIVLGERDGEIAWGRLYMEPVEVASEDHYDELGKASS